MSFNTLPYLVADDREPDGELVIGDRALIRSLRSPSGDGDGYVTDLSQMWTDACGLPFVFARWVVRTDAPTTVKTAIARWLDEFKAREAQLVALAVEPTAAALGISPDLVRRYFRAIRRCLDESDIQGQRRFFDAFAPFEGRPLFKPAPAALPGRKNP